MKVICCKCKKEYDLGKNIFEYDKDTNCPVLICPYCKFKHIINFIPFEKKIKVKKAKKLNLVYYAVLGKQRYANSSRVDQSGNDGLSIDIGWNINTAVYDNKNKYVSTEEEMAKRIRFNADGTILYLLGELYVYQYILSTAWDVSTASYDDSYFHNIAFSRGFHFSSDGTKMYILVDTSGTERVNQYTLSSAWDIGTASYTSQFLITSQTSIPLDLWFSTDGSVMYVWAGDASNNICYQYNLSTPWVLTSASYDTSNNLFGVIPTPGAIAFKSNGEALFITSTTFVTEYPLATAWDLSTLSDIAKSKNVSAQTSTPGSVCFNAVASKMYILGTGVENDYIYQYSLLAGWPKTTDFILCMRIYTSKGPIARAYKLRWRKVGGTFVDVGATGDITYNADTVLTDGSSVTSGERRVTLYFPDFTWQDGMENEGDNILPDTGTYSLADEYYSELQWALSCDDAEDEAEYEFELWDVTEGVSIGTCGATITIGITQSGFKWNTRTILKWCGKIISKWNTK